MGEKVSNELPEEEEDDAEDEYEQVTDSEGSNTKEDDQKTKTSCQTCEPLGTNNPRARQKSNSNGSFGSTRSRRQSSAASHGEHGDRFCPPRAQSFPGKREWGVLPPTPVRSFSSSSLQIEKDDSMFSSGALASPPALGPPKRLSRHLSCSSSYEMYASDIDTPLQQVLSLLNKVKGFVASLDHEAISAALADMEHDDNLRDHRSETSSLYSTGTSHFAFPSSATPTSAAQFRRKSRRGSMPKSTCAPSPSGAAVTVDTSLASPSSVGGLPGNLPRKWARRSSNRVSSRGEFLQTIDSYEEYVDETHEDVDDGASEFDDDNDADDHSILRRRSSVLPYDSPSHLGFSPIAALDQAMEILLDPESLMKPILRNSGTVGADHAWLNMVGALSETPLEGDDESALPASPTELVSPSKFRRQRSRLSSDELSSVVVTSTGKLLVESSSHVHLPDAIQGCENDSLSADTASDDVACNSGDEDGDLPHSILPDDPVLERLVPSSSGKSKMQEPEHEEVAGNPTSPNGSDTSSSSAATFSSLQETNSDGEPSRSQSRFPTKKLYRRSVSTGDRLSSGVDSMTPKAQISLGQLNNWNFDIIEFSKETDDRPLFTLMWAIFTKHNFFIEFKIDRKKFKAFAKDVELGYLPLPYHNSIHATDVLLSIHYLLFNLDMGKYLSKVESLAAIFSAAIHDLKHPGRSNNFLIKTRHHLSIVYNDHSILEQMHLAEAFRLLAKPGYEILENLTPEQWDRFRKLTIRMVLATDLRDHFETVTKLTNLGKRGAELVTANSRELTLEVAIKVADIGHSAKDFEIHSKWADRIQEEFFLQGDHEGRVNLPVTEFMDRKKANSDRNQLNFFENIALPLFQSVRTVFPGFVHIHRQSRKNHAEWKRRVMSK